MLHDHIGVFDEKLLGHAAERVESKLCSNRLHDTMVRACCECMTDLGMGTNHSHH